MNNDRSIWTCWDNSYFLLLVAGKKFKKYVPQADSFSRGLYMFDIGQNDLAGAFYYKTEDQVIASIPTILLEFENGLKVLFTLCLFQEIFCCQSSSFIMWNSLI